MVPVKRKALLLLAILLVAGGCRARVEGGATSQTMLLELEAPSAASAPESSAPAGPPAATPSIAQQAKAPAYQRGVLTATGFVSEYWGLRFAAPPEFVMPTEEELAAVMDLGIDAMEEDAALDAYAKRVTVYEMMAEAPSGLPNVIVMTQKLAAPQTGEEEYLAATREQLAGQSAVMYSLAGAAVTDVTLAGQPCKMLALNATLGGLAIRQEYIARKKGDRMLVVSATYTEETQGEKDALLACFAAY